LPWVWSSQLLEIPKDRNEPLKRYCPEAAPCLRPLVEAWESRYGQLYPRPLGGGGAQDVPCRLGA
jgi:hypothetical protein